MAIGVIISVFGGLILIIIAMVVVFVMWDKSFKSRVNVARQTGKDIDNVVWVQDRFKVVLRDGVYTIIFRNFKPKAPSMDGRVWTRFANKKALKLSQEEWETRDMRRMVQRGLFLYETSEGLFYPMTIHKTGDDFGFNVMDMDTRMFLADSIEKNHALTKRSLSELIAQIAIIAGIVIMIVGFIVGYIYINKVGQENIQLSAQVCSEYARSIINMTQSGSNQYIGNIPVPGLPGG